jgi:heterodisulfide reductase subunit A
MESHPKLKPIDTPVDGIFLAGACQAPKDIPYSVSQGSGAAGRAATILSKAKWKIEPIIAVVDHKTCQNTRVKCGICEKVCPYGAAMAPEKQAAYVLPVMCHGCGTCVAECPTDSIQQMHFTDKQIMNQIHAALEENPEEKILGFLCNWCSYAGADLAGVSRFQYSPNLRVVRVMCSGRIDPTIPPEVFMRGADGILVLGCHPADCHYVEGNLYEERKIKMLKKLIALTGLEPERLELDWVSAAEGQRFAQIVTEFTEQVRELGPSPVSGKTPNRKILENRSEIEASLAYSKQRWTSYESKT